MSESASKLGPQCTSTPRPATPVRPRGLSGFAPSKSTAPSADGGTGSVVWMYQMHASSLAGSLKTWPLCSTSPKSVSHAEERESTMMLPPCRSAWMIPNQEPS